MYYYFKRVIMITIPLAIAIPIVIKVLGIVLLSGIFMFICLIPDEGIKRNR